MTFEQGLNRYYEETFGERAPNAGKSIIQAANDILEKNGLAKQEDVGDAMYSLLKNAGGGPSPTPTPTPPTPVGDGKTRFYTSLTDHLSPYVLFTSTETGNVTIDWGDGNTEIAGVADESHLYTHTYDSPGEYIITFTVNSGSILLARDNNYYVPVFGRYENDQPTYGHFELYRVDVGNNASVGENAFNGCYGLKWVTILDGDRIGDSAFSNCSHLHYVSIPNSVKTIGMYAFTFCHSLKSMVIPDGVTSFGQGAFSSCYSLQSVVIPDSIESFSEDGYWFQHCYGLQSIVIPDGTTEVGYAAFQNCYSLQTITIPDSVTSIDAYAFSMCYGLDSIHIRSTTPPTLGRNAFDGIVTNFYVPAESVSAYKTAWSSYSDYIFAES